MFRRRLILQAIVSLNALSISAATLPWPTASLPEMRTRVAGPFLSTTNDLGWKCFYRPGVILVKLKNSTRPVGLLTPKGSEISIRRDLFHRDDIEYAELDVVLTRQFAPSDPGLPNQWHHAKIHSTNAWAVSLGGPGVTLAIVDAPFQMNHPDLAANTIAGWNMITQSPITSDPVGYYHSTIGAGMAAAVINNEVGVSGIANCRIMSIDVGDSPTESDMYAAIVWAADHGVRVVNLSWSGADSRVINDAGLYLKETTGGMLFMSGVNGDGLLNYPNQPYIYAVSMTDTNDLARSAYGDHIDFAAPGFDIYSTTTNSTYEVDSGTSYSAPLVAGLAAWVMAVNPALLPDEIEQILKDSCVDLGAPGWDQHYGWGRIDFAEVARHTFATLPLSRINANQIKALAKAAFTVSTPFSSGTQYSLFRAESLNSPLWRPILDAFVNTNHSLIFLQDPSPPVDRAFYQVQFQLPASH